MLTRNRRQRHNKHLKYLRRLPDHRKPAEAARQVIAWCAEARWRANRLGAPAVWALARDPYNLTICGILDNSGQLVADLHRVCAEAVADVGGRHLVAGSRPGADRARR